MGLIYNPILYLYISQLYIPVCIYHSYISLFVYITIIYPCLYISQIYIYLFVGIYHSYISLFLRIYVTVIYSCLFVYISYLSLHERDCLCLSGLSHLYNLSMLVFVLHIRLLDLVCTLLNKKTKL